MKNLINTEVSIERLRNLFDALFPFQSGVFENAEFVYGITPYEDDAKKVRFLGFKDDKGTFWQLIPEKMVVVELNGDNTKGIKLSDKRCKLVGRNLFLEITSVQTLTVTIKDFPYSEDIREIDILMKVYHYLVLKKTNKLREAYVCQGMIKYFGLAVYCLVSEEEDSVFLWTDMSAYRNPFYHISMMDFKRISTKGVVFQQMNGKYFYLKPEGGMEARKEAYLTFAELDSRILRLKKENPDLSMREYPVEICYKNRRYWFVAMVQDKLEKYWLLIDSVTGVSSKIPELKKVAII